MEIIASLGKLRDVCLAAVGSEKSHCPLTSPRAVRL